MIRTDKGRTELSLSYYKTCNLKPTKTETVVQLKEVQNGVDLILILPGANF